MSLTRLEKTTLGISGLTAVGVGGFILAAPQAFYASYDITLGDDASLLSEIRAPAAGLVTLGIFMLAGIWRASLVQLAVASALIVFLAFPTGRLISVAVDGMPSGGIIGALALEIAIAILCIFAFRRRFLRATPSFTDVPAKP
jgi:hypothetical protein